MNCINNTDLVGEKGNADRYKWGVLVEIAGPNVWMNLTPSTAMAHRSSYPL